MSKIKHYETMFILKPTLTEEETVAQIDGIRAIIEKNGGEISSTDNVGIRELAYEIEKEFEESLYYFLNDSLQMNFFLNPDEKQIKFYISEVNSSVVVKRLVTRAPTIKIKEKKTTIPTATLEKIMVDIFHNCYDAAEKYGSKGNIAVGANIAGFEKVKDAMLAQGISY